MSLNNKKIFITAGPTWVPIDEVRVIANIATGETGELLAGKLAAQGAKVTLALGPGKEKSNSQLRRLIRFRFFNELKDILIRELKRRRYDIIVHSCAVSDFKPEYKLRGKLASSKSQRLKLIPLEKLVTLIRHLAPAAILAIFKLEFAVTDKTLINRAKKYREKVGADLVVANRINPYRAFIIDCQDSPVSARSKKDLTKKLIKALCTKLNVNH